MKKVGGHNPEELKKHILARSVSQDWEAARREWVLAGVLIGASNCPCGVAIKEICFIENRVNGAKTFVGNVCVKNFMGMDTGNLFPGLKKLMKEAGANANEAVINYAWDEGLIYEREYEFLLDTMRKRKLSLKQAAWKEKINRRILEAVCRGSEDTEK